MNYKTWLIFISSISVSLVISAQTDTIYYPNGNTKIIDFKSAEKFYSKEVPDSGYIIQEFKEYNTNDSLVSECVIYGKGHYRSNTYYRNGRKEFEDYNFESIPIFKQSNWDKEGNLYREGIYIGNRSSNTEYYKGTQRIKSANFGLYSKFILDEKMSDYYKGSDFFKVMTIDSIYNSFEEMNITYYISGNIESITQYKSCKLLFFRSEEEFNQYQSSNNLNDIIVKEVKIKVGIWRNYNEQGILTEEHNFDKGIIVSEFIVD